MADDPSSSSDGYRPNPDFSFPAAFQPSIIRSFQKDSYYLSLLRTQFSDVIRTIFGSRFLQVNSELISLLAAVSYYVFSTYQGSQTLGEEYVGSRMVSAGLRKRFVSNKRRLAFIISQVVMPFLLSRFYSRVKRRINISYAMRSQSLQRAQLRFKAVGGSHDEQPKGSTIDGVVAWLAKHLPSLEDLQRPDGWLTYATTIHLMLFYLGGKHYKFGQRFARVRYISIHPTPPGQEPPSYEVLGVLLGVELGVKLAIALNRYLHRRSASTDQSQRSEKENESDQGSASASDRTVSIDGRKWSHQSFPAKPIGEPRSNDEEYTTTLNDYDAETVSDYSNLEPPNSSTNSIPLLYPSSSSTITTPQNNSLSSDEISNLQLQTAQYESSSEVVLKCTLCMDIRTPHKGTSCITECGHIFDWNCIMNWLKEKNECPLCRQMVRVNRVVPIYNI
ncbi:unnamed protein product [Sympodiomycopsis kandeliae]